MWLNGVCVEAEWINHPTDGMMQSVDKIARSYTRRSNAQGPVELNAGRRSRNARSSLLLGVRWLDHGAMGDASPKDVLDRLRGGPFAWGAT